MEIGWQFPLNSHGSAQGFQDGAIDTFAGRRLSAVVREVIQNSLDAHDGDDNPVVVEFSFKKIKSDQLNDLNGLNRHIQRCKEISIQQKTESITQFHSHASNLISNSKFVPVLAISDSNTTGLTGPIDDDKPWGAWVALTKGTGLTQKNDPSSLGSFGHGSKAPFAMSSIRTIYYLSKTTNESSEEEIRFQGKSILQTHIHPDENQTTQGTGFYGEKSKLAPLLNDSIPDWARKIREEHSSDKGTTIIIPHARFDASQFPETKITVIANFFYAIRLGRLEVIVDGEKIDQGNVEEVFRWCNEMFESEQDDIDVDHIRSCFDSIKTVLSPSHEGQSEIPGFGRIDWYIRTSDEINYRAVAISRQSGMLITKNAPQLLRFPGTKPFDMFIFVNEGEGSAALKRLENPAHDNFEFDRVKDSDDYSSINKKYNAFKNKIREILKSRVAVDSADEVQLSELSKLLFDLGSAEDKSANTERGSSMYISTGAPPKPAIRGLGNTNDDNSQTVNGKSEGSKPGNRGGKKQSGNNLGEGERNVKVAGGEDDVDSSTKSRSQVQNLRVIRNRSNPNKASINFTATKTGQFSFALTVAGETESGKVTLVHENKSVDGLRLDIESPGRKLLEVEVKNPQDLNFAMEGWLDEIS